MREKLWVAPTAVLTEHEEGRSFHVGWTAWLLLCVVAVALRGVRWDETYEHAQVVLGTVSYPEGHPLGRYVGGVYSIQPFATALHLYLWPNEAFVNGVRNVLMLASTLVPVYLLAAWLTRSAVWGSAATVLVMHGVLLELDGSYPLVVWPDIFSNGPIGQGYALLVLFLILRGHDRAGGLLLGLFPAVHLGQAPAVALWAALCVAWRAKLGGGRSQRTIAGWACAGMAAAAVFAVVLHMTQQPPPDTGPYAVAGDTVAIWEGFTQYADPHRRLPSGNGHVALVAALVLGLALARREREETRDFGPWAWLLVYVGIVAAVVWITMGIHLAMGPRIPYLLIGWMPYRLINHVPPILLVMICGMLRARPWGVPVMLAAVLYAALAPMVIPAGTALARYAQPAVALPFLLLGAAWGIYATCIPARQRLSVVAGILLLALLAMYHQWGALCAAAGCIAGGVGAAFWFTRLHPRWLGGAAVAGTLIALAGQGLCRDHLPRSAFDVAAAHAMAGAGDRGAMIAGRPDEFTLQARTGHPVFVESATASLISYMPELGPAINSMYHDVYGIRFDHAPDGTGSGWEQLWEARTPAEWQAAAGKYGVRYLVAPSHVDLTLELILEQYGSRLYRIPRTEAGL